MNRYRILTGIFCLLATGNVLAEEADTLKVVDVEEITVIAAPKENRKLREQPAAVTLLSQQDMQNAQVNSIKNLTSVVPNMFIPDYGSRLTSAVYIRGIGSRINTPSVGLYVDNIPYIDKSAFDFSYADVERIDVLRGPQGTLYGRNAMGGLIKVHTKSPFSYQGTDFRMGAGTYNAYNTSLTHYHRLSERFAFSTGGFYDYQGGFFRNTVRDEKADKGQSAGGRIRAIYLPSDNWKVDLNINYEYSDHRCLEITGRSSSSYFRFVERDRYMNDIVTFIIDHFLNTNETVTLFGHLGHLNYKGNRVELMDYFSLGYYLKSRYAKNYSCIGLITNRGTAMLPVSATNGGVTKLEQAPQGSLEFQVNKLKMDSVYLSMSKFTCSDVFLLRELGSGFSQNKKIIPNQFQYMIPKSRMEGVIFTKESVNFMKGKEFFKKNMNVEVVTMRFYIKALEKLTQKKIDLNI